MSRVVFSPTTLKDDGSRGWIADTGSGRIATLDGAVNMSEGRKSHTGASRIRTGGDEIVPSECWLELLRVGGVVVPSKLSSFHRTVFLSLTEMGWKNSIDDVGRLSSGSCDIGEAE